MRKVLVVVVVVEEGRTEIEEMIITEKIEIKIGIVREGEMMIIDQKVGMIIREEMMIIDQTEMIIDVGRMINRKEIDIEMIERDLEDRPVKKDNAAGVEVNRRGGPITRAAGRERQNQIILLRKNMREPATKWHIWRN